MQSKFTSEVEDKILAAIRAGMNQRSAAIEGGVTPASLKQRLARGRKQKNGKDKEFLIKYEEACKDAEQIWTERFRRGDQEIRVTYVKGQEVSKVVIVKQRASDALKWLQVHYPHIYDRTFSDEELLERFRDRYGPKWTEMLEELLEAAEQSLHEV